jgi:hypothetical protein
MEREMTETVRTTANLLDHLQEAGYDPEDQPGGLWFTLIVSGTGSVRVILYPDDGRAEVYMFDEFMACEWQVTLSPGTPTPVILAAIEAAEWQLAAKRGGPVTPAQVQARNA